MEFSWTTIIIVILLIVILYFVWTMLSSSSSSTSSTGGSDASKPTPLPTTSSNSFSFSTWLAINDWNGSSSGTIIKNTISSTTTDFKLYLGATSNDLILEIGTGASKQTITVPSIVPLQTWASIIVSVNNGQTVDIYINGKLVQTTYLNNPYTLSGTVTVGGGINGYISTTFSATPMGPQDAWDIYSSGFGSGSGSSVTNFFNKYKVRFAFVKDNVELSKLDI
jgi:hypothetical protein